MAEVHCFTEVSCAECPISNYPEPGRSLLRTLIEYGVVNSRMDTINDKTSAYTEPEALVKIMEEAEPIGEYAPFDTLEAVAKHTEQSCVYNSLNVN